MSKNNIPQNLTYEELERQVLERVSDNSPHGGGTWGFDSQAPLGELILHVTTGHLPDDVENRPDEWQNYFEQALRLFGLELETLLGSEHEPNELNPQILWRLSRRMRATAELGYRLKRARYHMGPNWGGPVPTKEGGAT